MLVLGSETLWYNCHFSACMRVICCGRLCVLKTVLFLILLILFIAVVALVIAFDALGEISIAALVGCWMKWFFQTVDWRFFSFQISAFNSYRQLLDSFL